MGQEDLLEKEMATHSSILAWKIPQIEEPGKIQSMGSQRVEHDRVKSLHMYIIFPCLFDSSLTLKYLQNSVQSLRGV